MAPMAVPTEHHHRSTTKGANKSFKSRHLSKGAVKDQSKGTDSLMFTKRSIRFRQLQTNFGQQER